MSNCPRCGLDLPAGSIRFCPECGSQLAASQPPSFADSEVEIFCESPKLSGFILPIIISILLIPLFGIGLLILIAVIFNCIGVQYRLTSQRLTIRRGILSKKIEEIELFRVKDVIFSQSFLDRLLGLGIVEVRTADATASVVKLSGIQKPEWCKEQIRNYSVKARRENRIGATELM